MSQTPNTTELKKLLKEHKVNFSKDGCINLHDIVANVLCSKNPSLYIKKVPNKQIVGNASYITVDDCLQIMIQGKSKVCKKIIKKLNRTNSKSNIIDIDNNIFQYMGYKFFSFCVKNNLDE